MKATEIDREGGEGGWVGISSYLQQFRRVGHYIIPKVRLRAKGARAHARLEFTQFLWGQRSARMHNRNNGTR